MKMSSAVIEFLSFFLHRDFHPRSLGLRHHRRQFAHRLVDTDPEFPRMEVRDHRRHSSQMVGMRMRDHHHVQMIDAPIPQIGGNHLLADVEVGMHPLRQPSGINQQCAALRA